MVNFTVKKETKKKNDANEISRTKLLSVPNRSITMDASVRRTKCIQYNLTQFNPIDYRVYIRNFISNN